MNVFHSFTGDLPHLLTRNASAGTVGELCRIVSQSTKANKMGRGGLSIGICLNFVKFRVELPNGRARTSNFA
jgi:hypothetical protein